MIQARTWKKGRGCFKEKRELTISHRKEEECGKRLSNSERGGKKPKILPGASSLIHSKIMTRKGRDLEVSFWENKRSLMAERGGVKNAKVLQIPLRV